MEFRVLGALEVVEAGGARSPSGAKERAVLARLLFEPGRPVAVDALLDAVWEDAAPDAAARSLSVRVARLRSFLEPGRPRGEASRILVRDGAGYRLAVDPDQVDAHRFATLAAQAATLPPAAAVERYDAALALWRGPPYADVADADFARLEIRRLEELRRHAQEGRARALVELGRHEQAVPELERLVAEEPLREELARTLMLALYRAGRQVDALGAYRALADRLDELGLRPVEETRELERRVLAQDPALLAPEAAAPGGRAESGDGALYGRERELERLQAALARAIAGERRVVLVTGEPGVGKTALVDAFLAQAHGRERVLAAAGQCHDHSGPGEPYLPILDALAAMTRGPDADRVVDVLARRAPTWIVELPWLFGDEVAEAVRMRARGATRDRMLREMLEATEALALETPLVLVVEDLQWADDSTADLLAALARRRATGRMLVVGTCRPGPSRVQSALSTLGAHGLCEEVALEALGEDAVGAYVRARSPGASGEAVAALARRTGGNPLFVGLLVDAWLDDTGDPLEVAVPPTLRAYIDEQLRALDDDTAGVLAVAAVEGTRFSARHVAAALRWPVGTVETALRDRPELVARHDDGWRFVHELHREVLYDGLPEERRIVVHRRLGEHMEATEAAGPAELAFHFVAARDAERAARYLQLAAEMAFARNAYPEGIRHLRAALDVACELPAGPDRLRTEVELLSELGQAVVATDGWSAPEAERALVLAREAATRLHDNEPLVSVLLALATLYEIRGEYERATGLTEECLRLAPVEATGTRLESHELLACNLFHQGAFARALEHADRGLELFDPDRPESGGYSTFPATLGDNAGVSCHDWAGLALWFLGYPDQALERSRLALELAGDPSRAYSLATAQAQLAVVHQCRREPEDTLRWAQATVRSAQDLGYAYRVAMGRVLRGWALAALGDAEDGVQDILGGLAESRATGARMDDPHYLGLLAEAQLRAGDTRGARASVAEAVEIAGRERSLFYEAELHRLQAETTLAAAGDPAEAEEHLRNALERAHAQGSRALELRAATALMELHNAHGLAPDARRVLAAALDRFTEGFTTPDVGAAAALLRAPGTVGAR